MKGAWITAIVPFNTKRVTYEVVGPEATTGRVSYLDVNGKTIEARGHAYGVGVFDAGNRFNYAGMIPGMS